MKGKLRYLTVLFPLLATVSASWAAAAGVSRGRNVSYYCTWAMQGSTLGANLKVGKTLYAGDQGTSGQRDNLNERILFGEDGGWARVLYPTNRSEILFLLDAGWDLPLGTKTDWSGLSLRGEFVPQSDRFPSLTGTPAERLRGLCEKIRALGWRGVGVWVPAHVRGDTPWHDGIPAKMLSDDEMRRVLTEKMRLCREAGVAYWKVDWGLRTWSLPFRKMISDVRDEVYPELVVEHCWVPGVPLNGVWFEKDGSVSGTGRLFGDARWERQRAERAELMSVSDVWRTYDEIAPFSHATTLERCAYYATMAEARRLPVVLNVEGVAAVAAGLGHTMGIMQSGLSGDRPVANDAVLALEWQKLAPPFGHDTALTTRVSTVGLTDGWTYSAKDCSWLTQAAGKRIVQTAPAVVSRGLPLPEVTAHGVRPFVCAARYPNGAVSLAVLTRTVGGRRDVGDPVDVRLDVTLREGEPLLVWGPCRSVTFACEPRRPVRVTAENLIDGTRRDITTCCRFAPDGTMTIETGDVLTGVGLSSRHAVIVFGSRRCAAR